MAVEETYSRYGRTRVPLFCLDACSTTEKVLSRDRPGWHRTTDLAAPWVKAKQG